jgi:hypothetical protein
MFQGYVFPVCTGSDKFTFPSEACSPYTVLQTIRTDAVVTGPHVVLRIFMVLFSPSVSEKLKQFLNFAQLY